MYNPDKEFDRIIIECLGKDGKSISALSKDLESRGIKMHRLIITGYLRAMTDLGYLKEREIPPSKIYQPIKPVQETITATPSISRIIDVVGISYSRNGEPEVYP